MFFSSFVNRERSLGPVSTHQSCKSSCPDNDWWIDMQMRLLLMRRLQQIESSHDKSPGEINMQKVTLFVGSPSAVMVRLPCHHFKRTEVESPGFFSPTPTCAQLNHGKESHWISGGMRHICPCPNTLGFNVFFLMWWKWGMCHILPFSALSAWRPWPRAFVISQLIASYSSLVNSPRAVSSA